MRMNLLSRFTASIPVAFTLGTGIAMSEDKRPLILKSMIDPKHLLQAIENSVSHSDETTHGVTGLTFRNYTITVRKRKGLSWYIECKFKRGRRDSLAGLNVNLVT